MVPCPPEAYILPCYSLMADGALQVSVSGLQKRTGEADTVERQMICKKKVFFLGKKKDVEFRYLDQTWKFTKVSLNISRSKYITGQQADICLGGRDLEGSTGQVVWKGCSQAPWETCFPCRMPVHLFIKGDSPLFDEICKMLANGANLWVKQPWVQLFCLSSKDILFQMLRWFPQHWILWQATTNLFSFINFPCKLLKTITHFY